jgi:hypothetical protein
MITPKLATEIVAFMTAWPGTVVVAITFIISAFVTMRQGNYWCFAVTIFLAAWISLEPKIAHRWGTIFWCGTLIAGTGGTIVYIIGSYDFRDRNTSTTFTSHGR